MICGKTKTHYFIEKKEKQNVDNLVKNGYTEAVIIPDETIIFLKQEIVEKLNQDKKNCIGCLSACKFSSW